MAIIQCNEEALAYFWYQVNANTIAYFPFKDNFTDQTGNRSLSVNNCNISNWVANITSANSYMQLNNTIGGSQITISVWYYYGGNSWNGSWNTLFARTTGTYHHILFPASTRSSETQGNIGFYNSRWYPSGTTLTMNKWYHIVCVKNGNNEKIYVNNQLVMNSDSSFNNNSYPVGTIANYTTSGPNQWAIGKMSDLIFETWNWSTEDINKYYNMTKNKYN